MKKIKDVLFTFMCVTTGMVFAAAFYITVFWPRAQIGSQILWQILAVAFLCSLGVLIYPEREVTKKVVGLLNLVYYVAVNVVVLGCGLLFGWFYIDNLAMVVGMLILIAAVFLVVAGIMWKKAASTAALMNKKLWEYQSAKQEETEKKTEKNS